MKYAHEKADDALKALTAAATDAEIAALLTTYLMVGKSAPIVFAINHNAKAAPCPVRIDKPMGDKRCSVALRNPVEARAWCIDALIRGYEVSCGTQRGQESRSIAGERRSIQHRADMDAYHAKRAAAKAAGGPFADLDDEIPF